MEKNENSFPVMTDEDWAEFDEIWARYIAGPVDHRLVTFTIRGAVIKEWLLNKYRAFYDLSVFAGERVDKNFSRENIYEREAFAEQLRLYAGGYLLERLNAILNSSIKGLITEIHECQSLIVEAALGRNTQDGLRPHLLSGKRLDEIWMGIIRDHIDPKFVKGRGGKQAKANLTKLYDYYEHIIGDWIEASEIFQSCLASRSPIRRKEWREAIKRNFSDLPDDLIERLQPISTWSELIASACATQGGEDKPEDIALEHAARKCGASNYSYKLSSLRENYNRQKRAKFETEN